jgi:hypothetical protein
MGKQAMGDQARRIGLPAAVLTALAVMSPVPASATPPDTLRLATGSVGGTFLPVGGDLVAWWARTLPDIVVLTDTTAGSVDNLDRLASGTADIAIVGSSPFREVLDGWGSISEDVHTICTLGTLYMDAEQFVVRSSLVRIGTLMDLNGLLMYPGPHGSGGEIDTRRILSTLGIEPRYVYVEDRDKGYTAAAKALIQGDFDAATFSGGVPIQAVTDLFRERPGEFTILPFSRHMLRRLQHYETDFEGVVIRASGYPGLTGDIQAVGGPNLLVAGPHVDARILARLETAIRDGIAVPGEGLRIAASHPVLQVLDLELWSLDPVGARCLGSEGLVELGGSTTRTSSRP